LTSNLPENWLMIANSTVTREHVAETFHVDKKSIALLNPPVGAARISKMWRSSNFEKEDLVVSIGRFEPERRFEDIIYALKALRCKPKVSIIGIDYDERYLRKLRELVKKEGLENNVELITNAHRKLVINRMFRAKAVIHSAIREPFGIAIVECMAAGCIPIVRINFSGPWVDIIQSGVYGLGFISTEELAHNIETVITHYESFSIDKVMKRALSFDESIFKARFLEHVESLMEKNT